MFKVHRTGLTCYKIDSEEEKFVVQRFENSPWLIDFMCLHCNDYLKSNTIIQMSKFYLTVCNTIVLKQNACSHVFK